MSEKEKEIRSSTGAIQIRAKEGEESRLVEGYACVFDSWSEMLGFWEPFKEKVDRNAFDGVIENSDVMCWLNHDSSRGLLARCMQGNGSLSLSVDERGLKYSFDAPHTVAGDELLEGIKRGDITGSSFAFMVEEDTWKVLPDETYERTINKVSELFDVSPVYRPAYRDTSVAMRSLDALKEEEARNKEDREEESNKITFNDFTL